MPDLTSGSEDDSDDLDVPGLVTDSDESLSSGEDEDSSTVSF